jgi:hypothetical protein
MYTFSEFPIFALTSIFSSKVDLYVLLDILITQGPVTYDVLIDRAPSYIFAKTVWLFDGIRLSTVAFLFSDDSDIQMFLTMMNA